MLLCLPFWINKLLILAFSKKTFYESEHAKRNIPTDLGKTKGLDVVTNALHNLDHFSEGTEGYGNVSCGIFRWSIQKLIVFCIKI